MMRRVGPDLSSPPTKAPGRALALSALLALLVGAATGCASSATDGVVRGAQSGAGPGASPADPRRPAVAPEMQARLDQARRVAGRGRLEDAVRLLESLVDEAPSYIAAHRLLQDLLAESPADWSLRRRYAATDNGLSAADRAYLQGRIEPDHERAAALFEAALCMEPEHPWALVGSALALHRAGDPDGAARTAERAVLAAPELAMPHVFLGTLALGRGDAEGATAAFEHAIERDPGDLRAHLGLLAAALETGQRQSASAHALAALRIAPGDPVVLAAAGDVLVRGGVPSALREALDVTVGAQGEVERPADLHLLRARLRLALGDASGALTDARAARGLGSEAVHVARRAAFQAGLYSVGVAEALTALPARVVESGNRYSLRWARLRDAARAADARPTGPSLLALGRALLAVGWRADAALVLARAAGAGGPAGREATSLAAGERRFERFLGALAATARQIHAAEARGDDVPSLAAVIARVARLSRAALGTDITEGLQIRSYPLLGEFAASIASSGPFLDQADSRGLLLLLGERRGQAPQIVVARIVLLAADETADVLGDTVSFDECWVESEGLPRGLDGLGGGLAGLTIDRLVTIQLDALLGGAVPQSSCLAVVPRPATTRSELLALDTPSLVAVRLEELLASEGELSDAMLASVRSHELGHVRDARRFLPFFAHPWRGLVLLARNGFDGARVESSLEGHAALVALVESPSPRAALASLVAFLPTTEGGSPHVAGYRDVIARAVEILADDPVAFPSLRRDRNILQQLDVLTAAEIRELGRRLLE